LLEKHKPSVTWDEESEEHYFLYDGEDAKHAVFYPTLASISARLNTANDVGSGLSIWEIGQGLEYFFDLSDLEKSEYQLPELFIAQNLGSLFSW
jgi:chitinase domain-containing protein 1